MLKEIVKIISEYGLSYRYLHNLKKLTIYKHDCSVVIYEYDYSDRLEVLCFNNDNVLYDAWSVITDLCDSHDVVNDVVAYLERDVKRN